MPYVKKVVGVPLGDARRGALVIPQSDLLPIRRIVNVPGQPVRGPGKAVWVIGGRRVEACDGGDTGWRAFGAAPGQGLGADSIAFRISGAAYGTGCQIELAVDACDRQRGV